MNILIVGPGAMGCLFACALSESGNNVYLLDKNPERARIISDNGIRLEEDEHTRVIPVNITTDVDRLPTPGLVCICVKSFDTAEAIRNIMPVLTQDSTVLTLQNGIGNVEIIAGYVDKEQINCGVTSQGSTSLGDGHIRHAGNGPSVIAPIAANRISESEKIAILFSNAGMTTRCSSNATSILWSKLIVNAAINPVSAIWNVPNGALVENADIRSIMLTAASEARQVALAKNIHLEFEDAAAEVESVCRATRTNISSMLQDVRRGAETEIESITGIIVKEAHNLGVSVPTNEMLLDRIRKLRSQGTAEQVRPPSR